MVEWRTVADRALGSLRSIALGASGLLALALTGLPVAHAKATTADRVAVRFFAAETGGIAHPKWIGERWLVFQATLEALSEMKIATVPSDRHMRLALEFEIADTLLSLSPIERLLSQAEEARLVGDLRAEQERRVGGATVFAQLAAKLDIPPSQITAWYSRRARALFYADRMIAPIRNLDDGELRQSFRANESREFGSTFEEAHEGLRRWLMTERYRALASSHAQAARGRTKVVIVTH